MRKEWTNRMSTLIKNQWIDNETFGRFPPWYKLSGEKWMVQSVWNRVCL